MTEHLPEPAGRPGPPQRRLTSEQFELVIRRAAEMQAREADAGDGLTEEEALRIGRELGLSGQHLGRALSEVRGAGTVESGTLARWLGSSVLRASRTVPLPADDAWRVLESYFVEREYMSVLRRLPDRLVLERGAGAMAAMGRAASQFVGRARPFHFPNLELAVQPLEEGVSHVTAALALRSRRSGVAAGSLAGGVGGGGALAVGLGIAVAPPAALLGLPVVAGAMLAGRALYGRSLERAQLQLESLLDRLEHGELAGSLRRGPRRP